MLAFDVLYKGETFRLGLRLQVKEWLFRRGLKLQYEFSALYKLTCPVQTKFYSIVAIDVDGKTKKLGIMSSIKTAKVSADDFLSMLLKGE